MSTARSTVQSVPTTEALKGPDRRGGETLMTDLLSGLQQAAVLSGLQQEFPGFRIWQEIHGERKRYVACRIFTGTRPHSVVTADPGELLDALSGQPGREDRPPAG